MSVNNESAFSGHLAAKNTEVRILLTFFWPGLVPLNKTTTEAVAEALLDIYSRVGIPEDVRMHARSIQSAQHKLSHQYAIPLHL